MINSITIKRSPIVLIRIFIAIEVVAALLYLLGTVMDPALKYTIFSWLPFPKSFTYQTLKLMILPFAQLVITIYAFLEWYRESYSLRPGLLNHSWGVFIRHEKRIPLDPSMVITVTSGPLGKLLHYGSIQIESGSGKMPVLKDISRPQDFLKSIMQAINSKAKTFTNPHPVELLKKEEGEKLEFKSSLKFDQTTRHGNRDLEKSAMKTIAAFLNSKGGYLMLGVDNNKKPVGIRNDYPLLQRQDRDGFENHFTQVFNSMIGPEFRHLINVAFHSLDGADVCVVEALQSSRPVYLKADGNEHFYIRTGNTTTMLKLSEIDHYRRTRSHNV